MSIELLLGDEAVAVGAIHAGIGGAFSYPGTPATEIFECIQRRTAGCGSVCARWSANEKVAYEEALGMSYVGRRALVSMKHVGLNVAADPFINSGITGVNGGLVIAVADDPGMHSSQNEQDSRYYGEFAKIPVFEPPNQQAAYDMTREAFELSERLGLPVMIRMVTRLCHSRANVDLSRPGQTALDEPPRPLPDPRDWTLLPVNARRRFRRLLDVQKDVCAYAEQSPFNRFTPGGRRGIIAAGLAQNYVGEALRDREEDTLLQIGVYPLPVDLIRKFVDHCDEILVAEDGYPFIETRLNGLLGVPGKSVRGKLTGDLPLTGELTPDAVAAALGVERPVAMHDVDDLIVRPPSLCQGCPHADTFKAMIAATAGYDHPLYMSDIGCYTLGASPQYGVVQSCVDMGASISMAYGAAQSGAFPVLCTIGDSTFTHSGMGPLLDAVLADADMTVLILDNATVAMTGTQETLVTGERLVELLRGLGVAPAHLHVIEPLPKHHGQNVELLWREISHRGLSVIVARRACIQIKRSKPAPAVRKMSPDAQRVA